MGYRALTHVLLGKRPPAEPGELIPDTYLDVNGQEQPVDFERLLQIGAAEKDEGRRRKSAAKAGEQSEAPEPE